ncbi:hypothetical protein SYNTR_0057 [Candidatus Syntrophocurvum alkaliphilum]|uniref:UPF0033 domain-containing protein n=1 Tax=Candidatus Syntrophocurvum alkaliphilum TaxID=2293317 RepID=A0A6I6DBU2_9FIRM|nr:sulfurtransferase-like selenium metabolism protein YedF [Candidatus Syntrophocurvum alkaliphilum]QGT98650.1 hypothetical protein SYNTR_0057 [Candidatus Syntrophocurvum alkaliphilum]
MKKVIDARGLDCPEPVILTKKAMDSGDVSDLIAIVDRTVALENVTRLAKSQGYSVDVKEENGSYYIHMNKDKQELVTSKKNDDIAILITSNLFGEGEKELGKVLMKSFLYSLKEIEGNLTHLIFMNSGVFLTTKGSEVIDNLKALENDNVEILSCGTCLDFYGIKESLEVGKVTNMYTALETLTLTKKSITV